MTQKTAIIIGAGPAGLTAAYELVTRTNIRPIILEMSDIMGGISRTVEYKGNRIDTGGHRFFSKSDRVMDWWLAHLAIEAGVKDQVQIAYQNKKRDLAVAAEGPSPETEDEVMLLRGRKSRIYYQGKFFNYPITLDLDTIQKLGIRRAARIAVSYTRASLFQREENNLEDFMINRFGRELYKTFFRDYTHKVWGIPCSEISAEWGAQRVKGLSLQTAAAHFFKRLIPSPPEDISQKGTETSLIEHFLYPKLGPGQMWEVVAEKIKVHGGEILTGWRVDTLHVDSNYPKRILGVSATTAQGEVKRFDGDLVFSTMAMKQLVQSLRKEIDVPNDVFEISEGLMYRDFLTVGVLLDQLKVHEEGANGDKRPISDNWLYIQDTGVDVGRIQVFNNWSPYLVADQDTTWIGMEYFCNEGDALWERSDESMAKHGVEELAKLGLADANAVRDTVVIRMPKTYPAYFGTYNRFDTLRDWIDGFDNLYLIGRNGMHRYNNQDHSMLTAMVSVDNILAGRTDKSNIWKVNTEQEYHETK